MAGKIRGISIELSADTTGIIKGLKNADASIKTTQKQLNDINRLLKLDPKNMTLLKQRTQALQTQIGNTKTKLDELKKAEDQMRSEGVDENSEQFQALQREIIATQQELGKLEGTTGSGSAGLAKVSQVAADIGDGLETAGKKLMPVTAGITALGAGAVAAFNEVDEGADIVIKKTGAVGDAAKELEAVYEEVSTSVVGSFEDAGKAVGEINTRFGTTGKELETMSESFLKFAKITDQDVEAAVIGVDKAMETFGVDIKDTDGVLGILAKTGQETGISVETLEGLLQTSGDQLKEMGLDLGESVQLMGNFEKEGLDSNKMLARLAKGAAYYQKQGKSMSEGLGDLVNRLKNSSTEADATAEAYKIFGNRGALAFITAAKEGKLAFDSLSSDLTSFSGVVDSTYGSIIDETDQMELIWKQTKVTLADAGKQILSIVAPAIQKLAAFVKDLSAKWKGMDDGTKKVIIKIAGVVAAIAPALIAFGKLSKGISAVTRVMSTMKFTKFIKSPVTLAIAAVAGLVAGLVALSKKIRNSNARLQEFDEQISTITSSNSDLKNEIESTNKEVEDNVKQTEASAKAAETLAGKLDELSGKENKTAEDKKKIQTYVEKLNELVPDLGLAYDEEADKLNKTNEQISRNISLMEQQAKVTAYMDGYTKALQEAAQAEIDLETAQDNVNEMLAAAPDDLRPALEFFQQFGETETMKSNAYSAAYLKYADDFDRFGKALDGVKNAENNLTNATKSSNKWLQKYDQSTEDLTEAEKALNRENKKVSFDNVRQELQSTFGEKYTKDLNSAVNRAQAAGVNIPKTLMKNIKAGNVSVDQATKKINALIKFDAAVKRANSQGIQIPKTLTKAVKQGKVTVKEGIRQVNDLVKFDRAKKNAYNGGMGIPSNVYDGVLKKMWKVDTAKDETVKHADVSEAATNATTSGENIPINMSSGMSSKESEVATAAQSVASTAESNLSGDGYSKGVEFTQGYIDGMGSLLEDVAKEAAKIVKKAFDAISSAQNSHSPSKVAMGLGSDLGEGYALGILDQVKNAQKAATKLTQGATGNLDTYGYTGAGVRTVANNVVYNQNNYSPRALTPSEVYRQSKNLLNMKGAQV